MLGTRPATWNFINSMLWCRNVGTSGAAPLIFTSTVQPERRLYVSPFSQQKRPYFALS